MDKRVNRYRSGAKHPHQQVLVSNNDDGTKTVVVFDRAHGRIQSHTFPGVNNPVEQGPEFKDLE